MQAAIVAFAVLAALTASWDIHQEANIAGNEIVCDSEGSATVDESDPTNPSVSDPTPVCSGIPPL